MARTPGPKHPEKYPVPTGESYDYYGEQPGFHYDPYTDEYVPDQETIDQFYEQSGIDRPDEKEKESDLVKDLLLPIGATSLAMYGVKAGIEHGIPSLYNSVVGSTAAQTGAQVGAQAGSQVGASTGAGIGSAAASGAAPFSMGAQAASGGAPAVPTGVTASIVPEGASTVAGGGTPWFDVGGPSYAGYLGAAGSIAGGAMNWDDWGKRGDDYRNTRIEQQIGEAIGNYFTGGLASLANQGLRALLPGPMNELDEFATKYGPVGVLTRAFGSKKGEDQLQRDAIRNYWQSLNFTDDNDMITLADGSQFNMGLDGGARLTNADGSQRRYHDVDFGNQSAVDLIPMADIIATLDAGSLGEKGINDAAGQIVNAATSSGNAGANLAKMLADRGLDHATAYGAIHQMQQEGMISQERGDAAKNALDEYYRKGAYAPGGSHYGVKSVAPPFSLGTTPGGSAGVTPQGQSVTPAPVRQPTQQLERAPFSLGAGQKERISPGVWRDEKGTYLSTNGVRGR